VRSEKKDVTLRLTLPVGGLLESSDTKTKRDLPTFISTELAFKSGWGIRYAFARAKYFVGQILSDVGKSCVATDSIE
jgi:hypothetical protein